MILKRVFKLILKWFLAILFSDKAIDSSLQNGRGAKRTQAATDESPGLINEQTLDYFKQAVDTLESRLDQKLSQLYGGTGSKATSTSAEPLDLNDLRADLAELRADIRQLKRSMVNAQEMYDSPFDQAE